MAEILKSIGLDVGTTTTQLILSQLQVENRASPFAVPELAITERRILYESPVHLTPLLSGELVDGEALRRLVTQEYEQAGIRRDQVDTGAVIITGEASRKENARQVLRALSDLAGDFVVATAGPHLESVLAAKGAGSLEESHRQPLLHMDIGGGTSNLALLQEGRFVRTGCLNVGGRLVKFDGAHRVTYVSPVLEGLAQVGQRMDREKAMELGRMLAEVLEMAAGLRPPDHRYEQLSTEEAGAPFSPVTGGTAVVLSGGVAECVRSPVAWDAYGDLGPCLAQAIRESRLPWQVGRQTLRATVIGAGCHATELSGSTVWVRGTDLPLKNLPVAVFTAGEQDSPALPELIRQRIARQDTPPVLYFPGCAGASYRQVSALAEAITAGTEGDIRVVLREDMAKALGHALTLRRPEAGILCLDGLILHEGDYLDVGTAVGGSHPVVVKTLAVK